MLICFNFSFFHAIIIENGKISNSYRESDVAEYMKSVEIKINVTVK